MGEQELARRCVELLRTCQYANIATSQGDAPWNTPVTALADAELNWYWSSWIRAQHSRNLAVNPAAFLTFYDSTRARGSNDRSCLYVRCEVAPVMEAEQVERAHALLYPGVTVDVAAFLGAGQKRFYRARPLQAWMNVLSEREVTPETQAMREQIPLESVRQAWRVVATP